MRRRGCGPDRRAARVELASRRTSRVERARIPALDRRARAGASLQQEPVEHRVERIDRVDVGREVHRRLRRARRDHALDGQAVAVVE